MNGKSKCKILKDIRKKIAEDNDIAYVTSECKYQGDCRGTCPKCEAEPQYLENELRKRQAAGKAIAVAGIAATLMLSACANSGAEESPTTSGTSSSTSSSSTSQSTSSETEPMMGEEVLPEDEMQDEENLPPELDGDIEPPDDELAGVPLPPAEDDELAGEPAYPPEDDENPPQDTLPPFYDEEPGIDDGDWGALH